MPTIEVSNLSKEYRLGGLRTLKETLANAGARVLGRAIEKATPFKALDDINFSVEQGEVVGIIGHNGAGKSTLLKMIARISTPTHGRVRVNGRISPLIEVGAGFVPDFTGRENVYLNASILGMRRREIDKKYDEIVAFAEMAEFMDTPVKRYSSGMRVKLAFSVATSVESEILIVDEVLAVGDLAFQQKCIERMEKLIKAEGRTVLIVGHNMRQIQRICNRVILLDHGQITQDGNPPDVCNVFYEEAQARNIERHKVVDGEIVPEQSDQSVRVTKIDLLDGNGRSLEKITMHQRMTLRVYFEALRRLPGVEIVLGLHTPDFFQVLGVSNAAAGPLPIIEPGKHQLECRFPEIPLRPGSYAIRLYFMDPLRRTLWAAENIIPVHVSVGDFDVTALPIDGLVHLKTSWVLDERMLSEGGAGSPLSESYRPVMHL